MQDLAATLAPAETSLLSTRYFSARFILPFVFFGALWFILCRQLSGEWSVNGQYNYGWFVPFFALYLFWLRWQDRPRPEIAIRLRRTKSPNRNNRAAAIIAALIGLAALLLLLPVRLFEIANPEWRPLGWIHAASVAALSLLCLWCVGGRPWLRHFAFPIAFFFVAVPWVTPIEVPIIQGLMRMVAAVAAETVTLFGIPTQLEGNLIRMSSGLVGVNEACSGVRSLQTALMIGLLFGELKRLSIWRRVALVAGAIAIALGANLCRAVFLVWIAATRNISEVNRWHELAGYAIVALVFIGTFGFAYLLGRKKPSDTAAAGVSPATMKDLQPTRLPPQRPVVSWSVPALWLAFALCWIAAVEVGAHFWYRAHERNLVATTRWGVQWPEASANFRELKIAEEVRRQLRFDQGHAASWTLPAANPPDASGASKPNTIICLLYLFRWNPGRNSALLANLHRPDVCLPAIGWTQVADTGVRDYPASASFALPFRHFEFRHGTTEDPTPAAAHAFYCLSEDRVPTPSAAGANPPQMATSPSSWTRGERVRQVLEGRRHLGQQVMEVVFVNSGQLSAADAESRLREMVRDVVLVQDRDD
ncbi:MAG TPA: exosortase/archaeosortase family protein [Lacipirellulaceae bacterium]|nr:exosortase/archaeosortase family protein [Lacipirellulaceae bacterium]